MKYACGHDSFAGVGDNCMACHRLHGAKPQEPVKKTGRPIVLTDEQRKANKKAEDKRTSKKRSKNKYYRTRYRMKNNVVIGMFVIEKNGLYLTCAAERKYSPWRGIEDAYIYSHKRRAAYTAARYGANLIEKSRVPIYAKNKDIRKYRHEEPSYVRYMILKDGKWRMPYNYRQTSDFAIAKVYKSYRLAEKVVKQFGGGDIVERHETEAKTIGAWKAKQMKEKV